MNAKALFDSLRDISPLKWNERGVYLLAHSSGGQLKVNSFIAKIKGGAKYYGFWTGLEYQIQVTI